VAGPTALGSFGRIAAASGEGGQPPTAAAQSEPRDRWAPPQTPWGDPDLQGFWSFATITPLERPSALAGKEVLTDEEIAELNEEAATRADRRGATPIDDVNAAYNAFWWDRGKSIGRTSIIVDPPDGRVPPLTPEAQQREVLLAPWAELVVKVVPHHAGFLQHLSAPSSEPMTLENATEAEPWEGPPASPATGPTGFGKDAP
jgi:hypothetical protein